MTIISKKSIGFLGYSILLFMLISLLSCASTLNQTWNPLDGKVTYADNDTPIDNAVIVAIWKGQMKDKGEPVRVCYHVETTTSNNKGQFSINSWREQNNYKHIYDKSTAIIVYKPGYWRKDITETIPTKSPIKLYLEKNSSRNQQTLSKHRMRYLQKTVASTTCHLDDSDRKKLLSLYQSVLTEAKTVAESEQDKNIVRSLKSWTTFASQ